MPGVIANNLSWLAVIMETVSVFLGAVLTFVGIVQLKKVGESRFGGGQTGSAGPVLMILCGGMLFALPSLMGAFGLAIFQSTSDMSYDGASPSIDSFMLPVVMFVRLIGIGSFMRGIVLISRSGGHHAQPGTVGKAVMHMIAGLLCMHIEGTVYIIEQIMGLAS